MWRNVTMNATLVTVYEYCSKRHLEFQRYRVRLDKLKRSIFKFLFPPVTTIGGLFCMKPQHRTPKKVENL